MTRRRSSGAPRCASTVAIPGAGCCSSTARSPPTSTSRTSTRLDFAYVRRIGDLLDLHAPPGEPLHAVHVGGGGFTLPRYLSATRPGSRSVTFERDGGLVDVARDALGLRTSARMRVKVGDGRELLARPARALRGRGRRRRVRRPARARRTSRPSSSRGRCGASCAPGGLCVLNVIDIPPLELARAGAATLLAVVPPRRVLAPRRLSRGREGGNVVIVASSRRSRSRACASGPRRPTSPRTSSRARSSRASRAARGRSPTRHVPAIASRGSRTCGAASARPSRLDS